MPVIRVNGLTTATNLNVLHQLTAAICKAVIAVKELGITSWSDIEPKFPAEISSSAGGNEIIVEVIELWKKPKRTKKVQDKLAKGLVEAVSGVLRGKDVCCFVHPLFDLKKQGFYLKRNPNNHKK